MQILSNDLLDTMSQCTTVKLPDESSSWYYNDKHHRVFNNAPRVLLLNGIDLKALLIPINTEEVYFEPE